MTHNERLLVVDFDVAIDPDDPMDPPDHPIFMTRVERVGDAGYPRYRFMGPESDLVAYLDRYLLNAEQYLEQFARVV